MKCLGKNCRAALVASMFALFGKRRDRIPRCVVFCGINRGLYSGRAIISGELEREEFVAGARRLERKMKQYRPGWVPVVGIGAYRLAFMRPKAVVGPQVERLGPARLWLLPQPSGLNANHQMPDLAKAFGELLGATEWDKRVRAPAQGRSLATRAARAARG